VGDTVEGIARHGRLKKAGPWGALIRLIAALIVVAVVSTGAIAGIAVAQILSPLTPNAPKLPGKIPAPPTIGAYPGGFNILIVGSDTRVGQGGIGGSADTSILNDVTMLLHVSGDHTSATAVSFPRDMVVPIPSCEAGGPAAGLPINTALFYGGSNTAAPGKGLPCVVKTVEALTGVKIQFAGLITFQGVIEVTDAVGGVPVCVQGDINDHEVGLHLKSGTHVISGATALKFLRSRHGVGDGSDLGRISSQQVYLSALVRKLKSNDTLSNVGTLYKLARAATQNMELTQGFNRIDTIFAIAEALRGIPLNRVLFVQYPGSTGGSGIYVGKVQPNFVLGHKLFALIKADKPFKLGASDNGIGSVKDPNAPKATATPSFPASGSNTTVIDGLDGQSSSTYTCSKAFHG
jgi:LCP family protein required for cell wall assembly